MFSLKDQVFSGTFGAKGFANSYNNTKKLTYQVSVVYCRQSVCDDKTCSSLSSLIQGFLNNLVRERVESSDFSKVI